MTNAGFLESGSDIFGNSEPFISLAEDTYVIVPNSATFEDLTSTLVYDTEYSNAVAEVQYFYEGNYVGETYVKVSGQTPIVFNATDGSLSNSNAASEVISGETTGTEESSAPKPITNEDDNTIFINVKVIIFVVVAIVAVVIGLILFKTISENYHFAKRRIARKRRKRRRTKYDSSEFKNLKF